MFISPLTKITISITIVDFARSAETKDPVKQKAPLLSTGLPGQEKSKEFIYPILNPTRTSGAITRKVKDSVTNRLISPAV